MREHPDTALPIIRSTAVAGGLVDEPCTDINRRYYALTECVLSFCDLLLFYVIICPHVCILHNAPTYIVIGEMAHEYGATELMKYIMQSNHH